MERVNKGEKYWRIWAMDSHFEIRDSIDDYGATSTQMYEMGNYFHTKEEAKAMSRKLRAVLKGADVIEMPSEPLGLTEIKNNHLRGFVPERLSLNDLKAFAFGFWEACSWLKSKIVK